MELLLQLHYHFLFVMHHISLLDSNAWPLAEKENNFKVVPLSHSFDLSEINELYRRIEERNGKMN